MKSLRFLTIGVMMLLSAATVSSQQIDPAFRRFWALNVEKSDFGNSQSQKWG